MTKAYASYRNISMIGNFFLTDYKMFFYQVANQSSKNEHIPSLPRELHWLTVKFCLQYKIATLAFCQFEGTYPIFLQLCKPILFLVCSAPLESREKLLFLELHSFGGYISLCCCSCLEFLTFKLRYASSSSFKQHLFCYAFD